MVDGAPSLHQLPLALAVRPYRRSRPRRRPVAHPVPQAVLQFHPTRLAWPVGTQRLAELRDHRVAPAGNILVCTEVSKFAGGVGLTEVERGVCNCLEEQIAVQDTLNLRSAH